MIYADPFSDETSEKYKDKKNRFTILTFYLLVYAMLKKSCLLNFINFLSKQYIFYILLLKLIMKYLLSSITTYMIYGRGRKTAVRGPIAALKAKIYGP